MPDAEPLARLPRLLLAGLGAGWLRPGPGTWASASTVLVCLAAEHLTGGGWAAALAFLVVGSLVTLAWAGHATSADGRHDPGWVVSDEWAGQGVALLAVGPGLDPAPWLAAFLLFRLLDIGKPGPIFALQRVRGGAGVLLDDLGAGLVAALGVLGLRLLLA